MSSLDPPRPSSDRNLLFGILALQMDFISRDDLIAAMQEWIFDKSKSLGQLLLSRGSVTADRLQLLEALVEEHVRAHGQDPQKSLAAISSVSSVHRELLTITDGGTNR